MSADAPASLLRLADAIASGAPEDALWPLMGAALADRDVSAVAFACVVYRHPTLGPSLYDSLLNDLRDPRLSAARRADLERMIEMFEGANP